jgi:DNA uptake protein ComE-like DNA-binding protein
MRHWLDPLARQVLRATGQLPPGPSVASGSPSEPLATAPTDPIDHELLALKQRQNSPMPDGSFSEPGSSCEPGWRLDVNRASAADWERLPGLTGQQRDLLLRLQAGGVQLSGPEDLQHLLEVSDSLLRSWLPLLEFRWYSAPAPAAPPQRLDLNRATAAQLQELGLTTDRIQRLQRERLRQPFRDLADLQQRLQLPATLVERWIGKVCFGSGPMGPVLPPERKRSAP